MNWGLEEPNPLRVRAVAVGVLFVAGVALWFWQGRRATGTRLPEPEMTRAVYEPGVRPPRDGDGARGGGLWPQVGAGPGGEAAGSRGGSLEVRAERPASLVVHVAGAVRRPGVYSLPEGARVRDALAAAGGAAAEGRPDALNLAARLADGVKVYVPTREEVRRRGLAPWEAGPWETGAGAAGSASWAPGAAAPGRTGLTGFLPTRVDLNRATEAELDALPGIGPSLARRIVEYRRSHGPFRKAEDLLQVPGIGPGRFEELRAYLTVR